MSNCSRCPTAPSAGHLTPCLTSFRRTSAACLCLILALTGFSLNGLCAQAGKKASPFRLKDDDGRTHSLEDFAGKILVLEFWSFKCPPAAAYDERMTALEGKYRGRGVVIIAVDSNKNEPADEVRLNRANRKLPFPVLMDQDGTLAESLGAKLTPSLVILDATGTIRYRGAIDNNKHAGERGRIAYAEDAIDALLSGQSVPLAEVKMSGGCSIKR